MPSIFSRIVAGELPCHRIGEDDDYLAFLDIRPIATGHALVITKRETDRLWDLDGRLLAGLLPFARVVAVALEAVVPCQRVGVMVAGLEVPHVHVHLVPMQSIHDLNFAHARAARPEDLAALAVRVREAWQRLRG